MPNHFPNRSIILLPDGHFALSNDENRLLANFLRCFLEDPDYTTDEIIDLLASEGYYLIAEYTALRLEDDEQWHYVTTEVHSENENYLEEDNERHRKETHEEDNEAAEWWLISKENHLGKPEAQIQISYEELRYLLQEASHLWFLQDEDDFF